MNGWDEAVATYVDAVRGQGRADKTLDLLTRWLARFQGFSIQHGAAVPGSLTSSRLRDFERSLWWQTGRRGQLYSAHSRYQCLQMVRAFVRWLHATRRLVRNLAAGWVLPRPTPPRPAPLTPANVAALLRAPDRRRPQGVRDAVVVQLLYHLALARREVVRLDLGDVNLEARTLTVRHGRCLALGDELVDGLRAYLETARPTFAGAAGADALFLGRGSARLGPVRLNQLVRQHAHQAGLSGVSLGRLRTTGLAHRRAARPVPSRAPATMVPLGGRGAPPLPTYRRASRRSHARV